MKKNIAKCVGIILLVSLLIVNFSPYYFLFGEVVESENGVVVVEDYNGDRWEAFADDLEVGAKVGLAMNDNNTSVWKDDRVENIWRA